jgi:hypothetical protein
MPILVRPVREQLEHDRVIRLLQAKYKRKFDVGMNVGMEQVAPIGVGTSAVFPDLVLQSTERSHKLLGVVEVETGESVNHLEAMSQWVAFGKLRAPFYLYVPTNMIDVARRLCVDMQIPVAEIWTYHPMGDQTRFTLVDRSSNAPVEKPEKPVRAAAAPAAEPRRSTPPPRETGARPARRATPAPAARRKTVAAKAAAPRRGTPAAKKKAVPARTARTQKRK